MASIRKWLQLLIRCAREIMDHALHGEGRRWIEMMPTSEAGARGGKLCVFVDFVRLLPFASVEDKGKQFWLGNEKEIDTRV